MPTSISDVRTLFGPLPATLAAGSGALWLAALALLTPYNTWRISPAVIEPPAAELAEREDVTSHGALVRIEVQAACRWGAKESRTITQLDVHRYFLI